MAVRYFALETCIHDPNGSISDYVRARSLQSLLRPSAEEWLERKGGAADEASSFSRPNLWLCDRLLAANGGYLDIRADDPAVAQFVAYFRP
jgi:hypothetical protein